MTTAQIDSTRNRRRLTMRTRECCGTTYNHTHRETCPARGTVARAALPCEITGDGWCAAHSTGDGPAYCA